MLIFTPVDYYEAYKDDEESIKHPCCDYVIWSYGMSA